MLSYRVEITGSEVFISSNENPLRDWACFEFAVMCTPKAIYVERLFIPTSCRGRMRTELLMHALERLAAAYEDPKDGIFMMLIDGSMVRRAESLGFKEHKEFKLFTRPMKASLANSSRPLPSERANKPHRLLLNFLRRFSESVFERLFSF